MKSLKHLFDFEKLIIVFFTVFFFHCYSIAQKNKSEIPVMKAVKLSDSQIDKNQIIEINEFLNKHYDVFKSFEKERMMLMPFNADTKLDNEKLNSRIDEYAIKNNYPYNSISSSEVYRDFSNDYIIHKRIIEEREFKLKKEKARIIEESKQ